MANREGRPLKFKTLKDLEEKIANYWIYCKENDIAETITGLAVFLNTSRETLMNYEGKKEYFDAIKEAKNRIEAEYEQRLVKRGNAGDIFALKNFGWKDKTEQDVNIKGNLELGSAFGDKKG